MVRKLSVLLLCLSLWPAALFAQSQNNTQPTDAQILVQANRTITNEQAFKGMTIVPTVSNGVVTLSGTVSNYAAKVLASYEIGHISGVRTVLNNLTINSAYTAPSANAPPYQQTPPPPDQQAAPGNPPQYSAPLPPAQTEANPGPPSPAQPYSGPSVTDTKTLILPSGTYLPVRLSDEINTATALPNQPFHADLVSDIRYDGYVVIPKGTIFVGRVISAQAAGRFMGYPELSIELTNFTINGPNGPQKVSVITQPISTQGKGRGENTAKKAGGGALLGVLVGALAGGGKGAAIGALAGGALGAGLNVKRGQEIDLKPEALLQFKTNDTTVVTVYLHNDEQITPTPLTTPVLLTPPPQQPQVPQLQPSQQQPQQSQPQPPEPQL